MAKKQNVILRVFEALVMIMILLVLIQTLFEDLAVVLGWERSVITAIKVSAFAFDLFFTLEFFIRLLGALFRREAGRYFFRNNGWIDLLASLPLLLLVSGPYLLQTMNIDILQIGFIDRIGLIKLIKAIRVTRILRFLRILKIFGKIKNVESKMAQRHISFVSTITIFSIIVMFTCSALLKETGVLPSSQAITEQAELAVVQKLGAVVKVYGSRESAADLLRRVYKSDLTIHSTLQAFTYKDDYIYFAKGVTKENIRSLEGDETIQLYTPEDTGIADCTFIFSRAQQARVDSAVNIMNFCIILFVLLVLIILYTRHFALTVTDPIYVMRNGFEKMDYTLAVKLPERYAEDDIFLLARDYNRRWLPAKMRKIDEMHSKKSSLLSLDDVFKT